MEPSKTITSHLILVDNFNHSTLAESANLINYVKGQTGFDQAIDFTEGVNAKYQLPSWYEWSPSYNPDDKQGTVDFWVYPRHYDVGLIAFNWYEGTQFTTTSQTLSLRIDDDGKLVATTWSAFKDTSAVEARVLSGNTVLPLNQWNHIIFTWSGNGTYLYVNSKLDANYTGNAYPALSTHVNVVLNPEGKDLGYLDELRIFKSAQEPTSPTVAASEENYQALLPSTRSVRSVRSPQASNYFDEKTGMLTLASVNVPKSTGGFDRYSATLQLVPNSNPLAFTLLSYDTPVVPKETAYFTPGSGKLAFSIGFLGGDYYWVEMDAVSPNIGPLKFTIPNVSGTTTPQLKSAKDTGVITVSKFGDKANNARITTSGVDCGTLCWSAYNQPGSVNTSIVLTAYPPADTVVKWLAGCDTSSSNTCTVSVRGIRNVEVSFDSNINVGIVGSCVDTTGKPTTQSIYASDPTPGGLIDFGSTQVGTAMFNHFVINKPAIAPQLCVEKLGINGTNPEDFQIISSSSFPLAIPVNQTSTPVIMQCTPSKEGVRQAVLTLKTNDGTNPIVTYTLQCKGVSEPQPGYWSDPFPGTEINFGGVERNRESATKKIVVTESGQLPLEVFYQKIDGKDAGDFIFKGPFASTIQHGDPQSVMEVACRPSDLGWREATLKLGSNDPDLKEISHPLKCEGVPWCILNFPPADDPSGIMGFLGGGYDSNRDRFKPEGCLNGEETEIGHTEAYLDGNLTYDYSQLEKELGFSFEGKVNARIFKIKASANFLRQTKETSLSRSIIVNFKVLLPNGRFELDQANPLSDMGKANIRSPSCWRNACGSHYISQTKRGADLFMLVKFNFKDSSMKQKFEASLGVKYKIVDIKAQFTSLSSSTQYNGSVEIKAMQRGGDATKLIRLFGAEKDVIDPSIKCSMNKSLDPTLKGLEECEKMMNNILVYAKEVFAEDAQKYPMTLDYFYSRYDELNIGSPDVETLPTEVIVAREDLKRAYEKELRNLSVVQDWLQNYSFPETITVSNITTPNPSKGMLGSLQDKINVNLEVIRSTAAWCFSDLTQCVGKQKQAITLETDNVIGTSTKGLFKVYHSATIPGTTPAINVGVVGVTFNATTGQYNFNITVNDLSKCDASGICPTGSAVQKPVVLEK